MSDIGVTGGESTIVRASPVGRSVGQPTGRRSSKTPRVVGRLAPAAVRGARPLIAAAIFRSSVHFPGATSRGMRA